MALNAKNAPKGGKVFDPMEAGSYPARVVQVVDLGLQVQRPFQGQEKPPAEEILVTYEFVDEFIKDENDEPDPKKPRWLSEFMPLRNLENEKARSTKRYKALDPENKYDGDFSKLVDTPCTVTVVHNPGKGKNAGRVYEGIANVAVMRKKDADKCPPLVNPAVVFDLSEPDIEQFKKLPQWVQKKIVANLNFQGSKLQQLLGDYAAGDNAEQPEEEENPY